MRWLTGTVSLVLFGAIIAYNSAVFYRWLVRRHSAHVVPFAAGLAGLAGFLALPVDWFHRMVWLPMAADPALPVILALSAAGWRWATTRWTSSNGAGGAPWPPARKHMRSG